MGANSLPELREAAPGSLGAIVRANRAFRTGEAAGLVTFGNEVLPTLHTGRILERQATMKSCSSGRASLDGDVAAVRDKDFPDYGEPDTVTARFCGEERNEYAGYVFGGDARAGVNHPDVRVSFYIARVERSDNIDSLIFGLRVYGFGGIPDEINEYPP